MYKTVRSKNKIDKTNTAAVKSHKDQSKTLRELGKCKIEYDDGSC